MDEKVRVEEYVRLKKWSLVSAGARSMHGCNKAKSKGWGGWGGGVRVKDKNEECCAVLVRAGILVCMLSRK